MQVQLCFYMYRETQGGEVRELVKRVQEKEPSLLVCALCMCVLF